MSQPKARIDLLYGTVSRRVRISRGIGLALGLGLVSVNAATLHCLLVRIEAGWWATPSAARLSFAAVVATGVAGFAWFLRRKAVRDAAVAHLTESYPRQAADIESYFSSTFVGTDEVVVRTISRNRLDKRLPDAPPPPLDRRFSLGRCALLALFVSALILAAPAHVSPWTSLRRYLVTVGPAGSAVPLAIARFKPRSGWLRQDRSVPVEVTFDRPVSDVIAARIITGPGASTDVSLDKLANGVYAGAFSPPSGPFAIRIAAEGRVSAPIEFSVYPLVPVTLKTVQVYDGSGEMQTELGPDDGPFIIKSRRRVRLVACSADCPLRSFGAVSDQVAVRRVATTEPRTAAADCVIAQDTDFLLYWQFPDGTLERSDSFTVRTTPDTPPRVAIRTHENKDRFDELPSPLNLTVVAHDDDKVLKLRLFVTDFLGFEKTVEVPVRNDGVAYLGDAALTPEMLQGRKGPVLGFCAVAADNAVPAQTAFSPVTCIYITPKASRDEPQTGEGQFWNELAQAMADKRAGNDELAEEVAALFNDEADRLAREEQETESPPDPADLRDPAEQALDEMNRQDAADAETADADDDDNGVTGDGNAADTGEDLARQDGDNVASADAAAPRQTTDAQRADSDSSTAGPDDVAQTDTDSADAAGGDEQEAATQTAGETEPGDTDETAAGDTAPTDGPDGEGRDGNDPAETADGGEQAGEDGEQAASGDAASADGDEQRGDQTVQVGDEGTQTADNGAGSADSTGGDQDAGEDSSAPGESNDAGAADGQTSGEDGENAGEASSDEGNESTDGAGEDGAQPGEGTQQSDDRPAAESAGEGAAAQSGQSGQSDDDAGDGNQGNGQQSEDGGQPTEPAGQTGAPGEQAGESGQEGEGAGQDGEGQTGEGAGENGEGQGESAESAGEGQGQTGEGDGESGEGQGESAESAGEGQGQTGEGAGESGEGQGESAESAGEGQGQTGEGEGESGEGQGESAESAGEGQGQTGEGAGESGEGQGESAGSAGEGQGQTGEGAGENGQGQGEPSSGGQSGEGGQPGADETSGGDPAQSQSDGDQSSGQASSGQSGGESGQSGQSGGQPGSQGGQSGSEGGENAGEAGEGQSNGGATAGGAPSQGGGGQSSSGTPGGFQDPGPFEPTEEAQTGEGIGATDPRTGNERSGPNTRQPGEGESIEDFGGEAEYGQGGTTDNTRPVWSEETVEVGEIDVPPQPDGPEDIPLEPTPLPPVDRAPPRSGERPERELPTVTSTGDARATLLQATEFEKILKRHEAAAGKLSTIEKRQTEDYYRILRDLK